MRRVILILVAIVSVAVLLDAQGGQQRLTKQKATEIGLAALKAKYPEQYSDLVSKHGPFVSKFQGGIWSVYGTKPKGVLGGGAPTIELRDHDGKVLRIYFAR